MVAKIKPLQLFLPLECATREVLPQTSNMILRSHSKDSYLLSPAMAMKVERRSLSAGCEAWLVHGTSRLALTAVGAGMLAHSGIGQDSDEVRTKRAET